MLVHIGYLGKFPPKLFAYCNSRVHNLVKLLNFKSYVVKLIYYSNLK